MKSVLVVIIVFSALAACLPDEAHPLPAPSGPSRRPARTTGPVELGILALYTSAALTELGSSYPRLSSLAGQIELQTNDGLRTSGVSSFNVTIAALKRSPFSEASGDLSEDLHRLSSDATVHAWMAGHDAVLLIRKHAGATSCGISYLQTRSWSHPFMVVTWLCARDMFSAGHELGHLMGSQHDRAHASTPPLDPNGYGHQLRPGYRTIMAYGQDLQRLNVYSNATRENNSAALQLAPARLGL